MDGPIAADGSMRMGDVRLIIDEMRHRHAGEFATALATLNIVRARLEDSPRFLEEAIARLEAQVRLERLLISPGAQQLAPLLLEIVEDIALSRGVAFPVRVTAEQVRVAREPVVRVILGIAHELVSNALRHHSSATRTLTIDLAVRSGWIELTVANLTKPGHTAARSTGAGLRLARTFAGRLGGRIVTAVSGDRHLACACFPEKVKTGDPIGGKRKRRTKG